jgi:UDP-N-acetylglucosamine 2-epimerase (non-hydrolysing)
MLEPIRELAKDMTVVFPVHPRTRNTLEQAGISEGDGLRLLEPLGYLEFVALMSGARLVITDSGGIQEETTVLRVPCVTLRDNTERPSTLEQGTNRLGGTRPESIRAAIRAQLASDPNEVEIPDGWDGRAADRVVERLAGDLVG